MLKKGFFMGLFTDIIAWFILFLGVTLWAVVFFISSSAISYQIKEQSTYLNNEGILLNYLISPTQEGNIADLIVLVYNGEDKTKLVNELDPILNEIYGKSGDICWKLWYYTENNKKKLLVGTECGKKTNFFDAETLTPTPDGDKLKIKLSIPGYKK